MISHIMKFLVDPQFEHLLTEYQWHVHNGGANNYVRGYSKKLGRNSGLVYLHRLIMGVVDNPKAEIDHINGNALDNRLCNLRVCSRSENNINRKQTKGYHRCNKTGRFAVEIRKDGKRYKLGRYDTEEQARSVYVAKAQELFGEFAPCA